MGGTIAVDMAPLSLQCRLASSFPPPRFHTIEYAGVLASACPFRTTIAPRPPAERSPKRGASTYRPRAELRMRAFGLHVLECPRCKGRMRLIAVVSGCCAGDPGCTVGCPLGTQACLHCKSTLTECDDFLSCGLYYCGYPETCVETCELSCEETAPEVFECIYQRPADRSKRAPLEEHTRPTRCAASTSRRRSRAPPPPDRRRRDPGER